MLTHETLAAMEAGANDAAAPLAIRAACATAYLLAIRRPSRPRAPRPARARDPWETDVAPHLAGRDAVTTDELLMALGVAPRRIDQLAQKRIGAAMRALGWSHERTVMAGVRAYRYHRPA